MGLVNPNTQDTITVSCDDCHRKMQVVKSIHDNVRCVLALCEDCSGNKLTMEVPEDKGIFPFNSPFAVIGRVTNGYYTRPSGRLGN